MGPCCFGINVTRTGFSWHLGDLSSWIWWIQQPECVFALCVLLFYFIFPSLSVVTAPQINMIYFHSFIYTARCTFRYPSKQILFFYVVIFFSSLYLSLYYYFCSCLDFFFRRCMCCWKAQALGKDLPGLYTELYSLLCDTGKIISTLRLRFTLSEWE